MSALRQLRLWSGSAVCLALIPSCSNLGPSYEPWVDQTAGGAYVQPVKPAPSVEPSTEPVLCIEAGMHTAAIVRVSIDSEGRWLATSSLDKTARLWDARTGEILRVLRPPIGKDREGMLYSVAMSPDGQRLACGGWTGSEWDRSPSVYLFERATGRLIRRLAGLPNVVYHLSFSPRNDRLAASFGWGGGIRVWRISDWNLIFEDKNYSGASQCIAFDSEGRFVTSCDDGNLRLYDAGFQLTAKKTAPGGKRPYSAVFSPDGAKVAVGFYDSMAVNVLSGRDLTFLYAPNTVGVASGNLSSVDFSTDGTKLYAGGTWLINGESYLRSWDKAGLGQYQDMQVSSTTIFDLCRRPGGGLFFAGGDPVFGYVDESQNVRTLQPCPVPEFAGLEEQFRISSDSQTVGFAYQWPGKFPAWFSVPERRLVLGSAPVAGESPKWTAAGLELDDWRHSTEPKLNGRKLALEQYEASKSLAIAPGAGSFVLGTGWYLRHFRVDGSEVWNIPAPATTFAVNISSDGNVVVAAFGDGTIRWHRLKDGKELLALFLHVDQKRWVLWTPEGYYDCSLGGEDLIGWHVNRGKETEADFFPASRFRSVKYRPDVIAKVLGTLDSSEALRLANAEAERKHLEEDLKKRLPPVVTVLSPESGTAVVSTEVTVGYQVRSPSGEPVTGIRVLVDGRPVPTERNIRVVPDTGDGLAHELLVRIPPQDCAVSLLAENRFTVSEPAVIRLKWAGFKPAEEALKPRLYVLAVGASDYAQDALDLRFAGKDALDFAEVFRRQRGGLYREVETRVLTDLEATRDNIMQGLEWLERQTTSRDVAVLFVAGHGTNDVRGNYYFLPRDVEPGQLRSSGVSFTEFQKTLRDLAGKVLFFFDTCHSGNALGREDLVAVRRGGLDIRALVNELASAEKGVAVFAASTERQGSLERQDWGNGAFTKAVVEGLGGRADLLKKGYITVATLEVFVADRVKELTGGQQTPVTRKPETVPDFPIALVR